LSRRDFRKAQSEERLARYTEVCRLWSVVDGEYLSFTAARARGGGIRSLGIGRHGERILQFTHPSGFKFERRIAVITDVIEAAGGLAGINDILAATLGTGNGNRGKPHRQPEWRSAPNSVKSG